MGNIYIARLTVPMSAIDANLHVNNLAYLHWLQGLIIEHALETGCTIRDLKQFGGTWAIVTHSINYLASAHEGDDIAIFHWVSRLGEKSMERRFLFYRIDDDTLLAEASTVFVYVDLTTGKGAPLPEDVRRIFAPTDENHALLRALQAETRDRNAIEEALATARAMSEASVNSLTVHQALRPREYAVS